MQYKNAPIRAAIYARVSTSNHGQNPEMQLSELREYCQRRGWTIAGEYTDSGISGTKEKRPQLDKLMAECKRKKIDAVVVYRFDRFARSLRQLVNSLEEFRTLGIEFVSLHEQVDTSTANGRLLFGIFGAIAEFERSLICERVKSGIAHARAKGKPHGRPFTKIDVASVRNLREQGLGWKPIAKQLECSKGTIIRLKKREGIA